MFQYFALGVQHKECRQGSYHASLQGEFEFEIGLVVDIVVCVVVVVVIVAGTTLYIVPTDQDLLFRIIGLRHLFDNALQ